jgi:hypothetical protein
MKQYVHFFVCFVVTLALYEGLQYFDYPFWAIFLFVLFLIYGLIFASNLFSFRIGLDFEEIPSKGYELRISDLEQNKRVLQNLGFRQFDKFYLRTSTDVVSYAYLHEHFPVIFCDYHFGITKACDLVTNFENGYTLTTSNIPSAGNIPRPTKKMLQIFPDMTPDALLRNHLQSVEFLKFKGLRIELLAPEDFRLEFMKAYLGERKNTIGLLSPIKLLYWMMSGQKMMYMKPVQKQNVFIV